MKILLSLVLINFYTVHAFTIPSHSYRETSNKGKTEIVYKQSQTGDENYFLHIKNVYVALPDLTKLFQSLGEHTTFQVNYPSSSSFDEDCKGPYCSDLSDFTFSTSTKTPSNIAEESVDITTATNLLDEDKETSTPETATMKNDKDTVEIIESTTPKMNAEVHVIQQKLPNSANTHEIFIPVQVIV